MNDFDEDRMRPMDEGQWSRQPGEYDPRPLLRDHAFNNDEKNEAGGWRHVSPSTHGQNDVGVDGIKVKLLQGLPDRLQVARVMSRALNATTGLDIEDGGGFDNTGAVRGDEWQDLLRGGLQAVMESFVIVFEVSGVSRACTHQIVRSRRAGFHQQSQRATRYTSPYGIGPNVRVPESVYRAIDDSESGTMPSVESQELRTAWNMALFWSRRAYRLACEANVSYQDARYILPEGTENYILCEYTWREFLGVYDYRACSMFNWEIVHVVREMGRLLKEQSPWIVGTGGEPRISCEKTRHAIDDSGVEKLPANGNGGDATAHACTFQGWEKVEGQCGFPWARESNRTFKPSITIG